MHIIGRRFSAFVEEEAELSGDDVGSDDEADKSSDDEYEPEAGDADALPDDEEMRANLVKTHMKLQNIDEERHLNVLKERYEAQLNPTNRWDRSFRSRLADQPIDFANLVGDPLDGDAAASDDEDDQVCSFKQHALKEAAKAKEASSFVFIHSISQPYLQKENERLFSMETYADDMMVEVDDPGTSEAKPTREHLSISDHTHINAAVNTRSLADFTLKNFRSAPPPPLLERPT